MRICTGLIALMLLTGCQSQSTSKSPVSPPSDNIQPPTPVQNVSYGQVLEQPHVPADARLRYGSDPLQFGELWLPEAGEHPAPLVVFVHGGCWLNQFDLTHSYPAASALQQQGFAVWSIEYRRTGDTGGGWPGSLQDIVQAIEFIQTQQQYQIDSSSISLVGHSAGGHLALLASKQLNTPVDKVIGLAPIIDIERYARGENSCQAATAQFMGGTPNQRVRQYAQANPMNFSYDGTVAILTGGQDQIVPLPENPLPATQFVSISGAGHFDWVHPGTLAFSYFVDLLEK
ncbi:alpha/beta hydrolase [Salinimonas marina]|uniref:Alpha/beta hydrolase n=1 Tax=Salinimonas marina TaxID=2785918 RepID=A0A7S9HBH9_9ALTE|nr:alpha/beta hydrolase [Salinimonas marina]QPG04296.1 alpha/beta hydrolase [Salinimonas marina]